MCVCNEFAIFDIVVHTCGHAASVTTSVVFHAATMEHLMPSVVERVPLAHLISNAVAGVWCNLQWVSEPIAPTEVADYCFLAANCMAVKEMKRFALDALCRTLAFNYPQLRQMAPDDILSLLKLASSTVTDSWSRCTIEGALGHTPGAKRLTGDMLLGPDGLIETAMRNKDDLLLHLMVGKTQLEHATIPAAKEHIDRDLLLSLLRHVVAAAPRNVRRPRTAAAQRRKPPPCELTCVLGRSPIAEEINASGALGLLRQAITVKNEAVFVELCALPVMTRLHWTSMRHLIEQARQLGWVATELDLVTMPNAMGPEEDAFMALLDM